MRRPVRALAGAALLALVVSGAAPAAATAQRADLTLDSLSVRASSARTLSQLLAGRVPGLSVTYASGARGLASQVRARGASGLYGAAEPLLYVDGVLVREDRYQLGPRPDFHRPSFTWDLPVEEIETVEVYLGQSSAALMEFGAARGVVRVTTRRPVDGATRVGAFAEGRSGTESTAFPANVGRIGVAAGGITEECTLSHEALGNCLADQMFSWNPLEQASPFGTARGTRAGVNASGAAAGGAYRASVVADRDDAVLTTIGGARVDLAAGWRSALGAPVALRIDARHASADANYVAWETGVLSSGMLGARANDAQDGYSIALDEIMRYPIPIRTARSSLGVGAGWKVNGSVDAEVNVAVDRLARRSRVFGTFTAPDATLESSSRASVTGWTADAGVRLPHRLLGHRGSLRAALFASGSDLRDSTFFEALTETGDGRDIRSVRTTLGAMGLLFEERLQLGGGEGRTIGAGVRASRYGFGTGDLDLRFAHQVDASWDLAAERFFPRIGAIDRLVVRAAHGAGVDVEPLLGFAELAVPVNYDATARPPRVAEGSVGVHLSLHSGAVALDMRAFDRRASDLPMPTTVGVQPGERVDVRGGEVALSLRDRLGPVAVHSRVSLSGARERVRRLGIPEFVLLDGDDLTLAFVQNGGSLGELAVRRLQWEDFNGDGIVDATEVTVLSSSSHGVTRPSTFITASGDVAWRAVSMGAVLDVQRGHHRYDVTQAFRCRVANCAELYDPSTPLADQANAVAAWSQGFSIGAMQASDFARLREVWVRVALPAMLVPPGLGTARLTLAGQHLATWTRYRGQDPEIGVMQGSSVQWNGRMGQPLLPTWSLRLDVGR